MSINRDMNYEQVLAEARESNTRLEVIGIKADLAGECYRAIGENAKRCHDTLKVFNDEHFPRVQV